jgi:hypothetical protein
VAQQQRSDALCLVLVDNGESHFRAGGSHHDVARTANDRGPPSLLHHGDKRHVVHEVDGREIRDFVLREVSLWGEEATIERLRAAATDRCEGAGPVVRLEGAYSSARPLRSSSMAEYLAAFDMIRVPRPLFSLAVAPPVRVVANLPTLMAIERRLTPANGFGGLASRCDARALLEAAS